MHTCIDVTNTTISGNEEVTPDSRRRRFIASDNNPLIIWRRQGTLEPRNVKGMGVFLSETPIPFEDGVMRKRLNRLIHACPVDAPVGNNTLSLAFHQLK